ncbi:MAG: iron-containing alcohol dehydrogenase [Eubacterium sp.]|jgi:alcohol dehydrogenase YqhD (iron-dependent ADH family)
MVNDFTYYTPTKIIFGRGAEKQTGEQIKAFGGTKALVVYGSDRVLKNGLMDTVLASLDEAGIGHVLLGGVVPNPLLSLVYTGIDLAKKENVDFLLAIGGGSVIDTAKAIGYGLAEPDRDVWELYDHKRKAEACYPVAAVLTIAAAGSEMSDSSVITNEKTGEKRGYSSDFCRCRFAVMNPELTITLPDYQTMSGCADMQMHTMERYFTRKGSMEITDALAEGLMRTVMEQAVILHTDPANYDARAVVMWASSLAHNGLTGCGNGGNDFATHRLEHELGGMFNVTHGAGLCAVWGSWARYVYKDCLPRFVRFAEKVHGIEHTETDEETALKGIEAQEAFYRSIGMPTDIRELGIDPTEDQLREMAHRCSIAVGGKIGAAKELREEDMYEIYKMALKRP